MNTTAKIVLGMLVFATQMQLHAQDKTSLFPKQGITISTDEDWFVLPAHQLKTINLSVVPSILSHAEKIGKEMRKTDVESEILLLCSKRLMGLPGDNPNFLLATEKVWTDKFERTGEGYLDLMQDRVERLGAPTRFDSRREKMKIGKQTFYFVDAINTNIPKEKTKQRYICTFANGRYVYFVLSFNEDDDPDFKSMMKSIRTLRFSDPDKLKDNLPKAKALK